MSREATDWAISVRGLKPSEFRVLMVLADCHNGRGKGCFPSGEYLREACEMSNGTLYNNLGALEQKGLIQRLTRADKDGKGRSSTAYTFPFEDHFEAPEDGGANSSGLESGSPEIENTDHNILCLPSTRFQQTGIRPVSSTLESGWDQIPENGGPDSSRLETEPGRNREDPLNREDSCEIAIQPSLDIDPPEIVAVEAWNDTADRTGWPKVANINQTRKRAIAARLKDLGGLKGWGVALARAEQSDFLCGRTDRPFRCTFDWLTKPANLTKLMEGNYDNRTGHRAAARPGNADILARSLR